MHTDVLTLYDDNTRGKYGHGKPYLGALHTYNTTSSLIYLVSAVFFFFVFFFFFSLRWVACEYMWYETIIKTTYVRRTFCKTLLLCAQCSVRPAAPWSMKIKIYNREDDIFVWSLNSKKKKNNEKKFLFPFAVSVFFFRTAFVSINICAIVLPTSNSQLTAINENPMSQ